MSLIDTKVRHLGTSLQAMASDMLDAAELAKHAWFLARRGEQVVKAARVYLAEDTEESCQALEDAIKTYDDIQKQALAALTEES